MVYIPPQSLFSLLTGALKLSQVGYRAIEKAISKGGETSAPSLQDFRNIVGKFLPRGMEGSFSIQESRRPPSPPADDTLRDVESLDITVEEQGGSAALQEQVLRRNIQTLAERISHYRTDPDASDDFWLWSVNLDDTGRIVRIYSTSSNQLAFRPGEEMNEAIDIVLKQSSTNESPTLLWYNPQFSGTPMQHEAMRRLSNTSSQAREKLLQRHPYFLDDPLFRVGHKSSEENFAPLLRDLRDIIDEKNSAGENQFQVLFHNDRGFVRAAASIQMERGGIYPSAKKMLANVEFHLDRQSSAIKVRTHNLISYNQDAAFLMRIQGVLRYIESLS